MSRLSNSIRQEMAQALVRHRFNDDAQALIAQTRTLFKKLYEHNYNKPVRDHMAAILKHNRSAFKNDTDMRANVAGREITVGKRRIGTGDVAWSFSVEPRCFLADITYHGVGIAVDEPIAAELIAFDDAHETLRKQIPEAYRKALGALSQFTTGKKLATEWPEAMSVIGALIPEDDRSVPIVQVAGLNREFDLPAVKA